MSSQFITCTILCGNFSLCILFIKGCILFHVLSLMLVVILYDGTIGWEVGQKMSLLRSFAFFRLHYRSCLYESHMSPIDMMSDRMLPFWRFYLYNGLGGIFSVPSLGCKTGMYIIKAEVVLVYAHPLYGIRNFHLLWQYIGSFKFFYCLSLKSCIVK